MDAILITGCPALLESRGPNHEPPRVRYAKFRENNSETDWQWTDRDDYCDWKDEASPLWWRGPPCYPAIDAAARLVAEYLELDGRIFCRNMTRDAVLEVARQWARVLGATLINLEPTNAPNA